MEQTAPNLKVTLENQLSIPLKYWTVIQEHNRSLIHGKLCGNLHPTQYFCLDINPSTSEKICTFPVKLNVTAQQKDKTITKRYTIEEAGHYIFVPHSAEIFVIIKRITQQP